MRTAALSCWVRSESPEIIKMSDTAPYFTVYSGSSGPSFAPTSGAARASRMETTTPTRNQCFTKNCMQELLASPPPPRRGAAAENLRGLAVTAGWSHDGA